MLTKIKAMSSSMVGLRTASADLIWLWVSGRSGQHWILAVIANH